MPLRRFASICTSFAVICSLLVAGSVARAQQADKPSTASRKTAKKNKRKRQTGVQQFVLPPTSIVSTSNTSGSPDTPSISPGAPVTIKRSVSTQSIKGSQRQEEATITSSPISPAQSSTIVLRDLTTKRTGVSVGVVKGQTTVVMPPPQTIQEVDVPAEPGVSINAQADIGGPLVSSPPPAQTFAGENDEAVGGGGVGTFTIPPDTMGAVGIDKIFTSLNNNVVIQDKTTGAKLSTTGLTSFWNSTGASGVFDPRVLYDPYNNRWIVAAVSNAQTSASAVLIGISQTSDPMGAFNLFRFVVGCAGGTMGCNSGGEWADFPMLGFNKNWIAISVNMFTINTLTFTQGKILVLDYPTLRGGTTVASLFAGATAAIGGFCLHPVTTLSNTEETLYLPTHISSAGATYKLHTITGTPASPTFNVDLADRTRPGGGWTQPGGDVLPQQCIPGVSIPTQTCPATIRQIDVTDAFIRSNAVFRNGKIYYPQTIALPTGGITNSSRFAAQWTSLNSDGSFFDGGRIEDATATRTNGGKHYAMPSIAVNKNNDVLIGFSEFESDDYADAGYAFRVGTDAAGTLRDPVIYKEGEDYYQKTFSGSRNRWGDYSHSVVDPVNDRDLWTLQEYAQPRVGTTGLAANDSRWGTWWAKVAAPAGAGDLIISEFRLRGPNPNSAQNEFIEIYNPASSAHTVVASDASAGYGVAASDGVLRCTVPNGTVIPSQGHFLCTNSVGYALSSYPAGAGTTATGDATYTADIPDNAGIALFASTTTFTLANRIDAVGSTSEANTLYKEGTGYPALSPFSIEYSFYRSNCPNNTGVFGTALGCAPGSGGLPKDTDNNANDFVFVDANGTSAGAGQRLGAPGPENLSAPLTRNSLPVLILDSSAAASAEPNRVRDLTPDPANNSLLGTLEIRRRIQNNTGTPITRLRFRVIDINTFPAPTGFADLRTRTSTSVVVSGVNDAATCSPGTAPCTVNVQGTTLEQPPSQPIGGAFNSTYSADTITLATPLAPGASVNVRILMGVQQAGSFRFFLNVEALP